MKPQRESNVELLRIVAMSGVVFLHYYNSEIGGAIRFVQKGSINELILQTLEATAICAVNLFIMISGYFLCSTSKRSIGKCLSLLLKVSIFRLLFYVLDCILLNQPIMITKTIYNMLPVDWFVVLYCAVYLVSPLINRSINGLKKQEIWWCILILLGLFSVFPTIQDVVYQITEKEINGLSTLGLGGSGRGYTIVNFLLCYIIGALIKETDVCSVIKRAGIKKSYLIYAIIAEISVITGWSYINAYTAREYCNPVVILEAITALLIFVTLNLNNNVFINQIAKVAMTVYLIHCNILKKINIESYVRGNPIFMIGHIFIVIVFIIILGIIVDSLYRIVFGKIDSFLVNKWSYTIS